MITSWILVRDVQLHRMSLHLRQTGFGPGSSDGRSFSKRRYRPGRTYWRPGLRTSPNKEHAEIRLVCTWLATKMRNGRYVLICQCFVNVSWAYEYTVLCINMYNMYWYVLCIVGCFRRFSMFFPSWGTGQSHQVAPLPFGSVASRPGSWILVYGSISLEFGWVQLSDIHRYSL